MTVIRKKRIFWLIVLAGLLIRICLISFSSNLNINTDAWVYDRIAQNIAFKGTYSMQKVEACSAKPTAIYPPVYPMLLASIYYIFGYKPLFINYLHIALYLIACIVIFKLSSILFNETTGVWGTLFFTFEPVALLYSIIAMPEILIAVFLPLSIYFLIKFFKQNAENEMGYKYLILSNIILAIAMLTKPIIFYLPLLTILFIFIYWRKSIKRAIIASLVTIVVTGFTISPWIIRNYKIWNKYCFAETKGFLSPEKKHVLKKIHYIKKRFSEFPESIKNPAIKYIFGTSAITFYRTYDRPDNLHKYYTSQRKFKESRVNLKLPNYLSPNINDYIRLFRYSWKFAILELLFLTILLIIYLFSSIGIFLALKNRKLKELLVCVFVIAYFAMIILLDLASTSRHRFPSIPFYSILAGYGLSRLTKKRGQVSTLHI